MRGLEVKADGFGCDRLDLWGTDAQPDEDEIVARLMKPGADRVWYIRYAFKSGMSVQRVFELTGIDPWFLDNLHEIVETEEALRQAAFPTLPREQGQSSIPEILAKHGYTTSEQVMQAMADMHGYEYFDLQDVPIPSSVLDLVPESLARKRGHSARRRGWGAQSARERPVRLRDV